jgi:2'-5' RNA ligase
MIDPIGTVGTRAPEVAMGDNANRADLLGGSVPDTSAPDAQAAGPGLARRAQRVPDGTDGIAGTAGPELTEEPEGTAGLDRSRSGAGNLMRLFVAIAPPPAVLDELDALVGPLRSSRQELRWTNREAWHVTLAFLGQVEESALVRLMPRLERAARRHLSIPLAFSGAGAFPAPRRANVLWSGLSGDRRALARLAESVVAGASRAGTPPPDKGRRFQPHLTLARCRMPADVTELVEDLAGYRGQPWTADRIHLVRSRLGGKDQPRYVSLGSWPLNGAGGAPRGDDPPKPPRGAPRGDDPPKPPRRDRRGTP